LIDRSNEIYPYFGGTFKTGNCEWEFPIGNRIGFRHLSHPTDIQNYIGAEIALICFDELDMFDETAFWFLLSRNRSKCGVQPYIRGTCNPNPDSFVAKLVEPYLDENGISIPEMSGVVRHFARIDGEFSWVEPDYPDCKSFSFIPSRLSDNPALTSKDKQYERNLKSLDLVSRARLLDGNWKIRDVAGLLFRSGWVEIVDHYQWQPGDRVVRAWDFAATERKLASDDPDYTATIKIAYREPNFFILDAQKWQAPPLQIERQMVNLSVQDGAQCWVRWEQEHGGSAAIMLAATLTKVLQIQMPTINCAGIKPIGDKVSRFRPFSAAAEFGKIKILRNTWNAMWLNELSQFPTKGIHDDLVDATSLGFNSVSQGQIQQGRYKA
jgi:predicted phage terminase large subunit-like protein